MSFESFSLHPQILKALNEAGYTEPTPIQAKAMPKIMRGFNLRGSANTGSGKTAAFLLPAIQHLATTEKSKGKGPRILILAPTRELAMQIETQAIKYSKFFKNIRSVCVGGGVPYPVQLRKMARPYEIMIATPGRLIDYLQRGKVSLARVEMLILDEADRMLDMGFLEPVEEIVSHCPEERQSILFSATLEGPIKKLSERLMDNPMDIVVRPDKNQHEAISQHLHFADDLRHKNLMLDHILTNSEVGHAIIFTATKRYADELVRSLHEKGHRAAALHGDMSQHKRTKTVARMRDGKIKILVATDVAARGIDVPSITHVINFDLPNNVEDYVHRIGRTGRAGASGTALSFALNRDNVMLKRIEQYLGKKINVAEIEGLEPRPQQKKPKKRPTRQEGRFRQRRSKFGRASTRSQSGKKRRAPNRR